MFSCSATKEWLETNNLCSLFDKKKDIKNNKEYNLTEKLLKKHHLNL